MKTVQLLIQGKVQGVFYRASAKEKADRLGISGWVKNTADGDVAILCQGTELQLQEFITWCKQGPSGAKVENVVVDEIPAEQLKDFVVIRGR